MDETATLAESHTEMTEILLPNDTNTYGRALGGVVLHWMDVCGAIAAMRFANRGVVTASMDHVDFISPIDLGEVAIIEGYVFNTGRTSLDDEGDPTPVPDVDCPTDEEVALRDGAKEERRRQLEDVVDRLESE
ncbi:acyl-CoA hydrolase [Halalkaliarchaeum desulfuricum]|uniref:Acyl-CoA hydrolase n=1 Tax=Halalkaliarchaeum desulfuricum TaxID=2055893 RepID=A0A343TMB9_9EURY|nr:hotdog domain-containing protein [Halalkaliarchaeum desulfuricum]AUX10241.1 acyl-CoA hydrolase [Halalkaliarchaeum desulfuricum]